MKDTYDTKECPQGMHIQTLPTVVTVIGGDARLLSVASRLAETVCTVQTVGVNTKDSLAGEKCASIRVCADLWEAWDGSHVMVLPLPVTRDGETVWCPLEPDCFIGLEDLVGLVHKRAAVKGEVPLVFGGCIPEHWRAKLESAGGEVIDYYEREDVQIKNAQITAEGAVMTAMELTDKTLLGATAAVLGYGRIGRLLARILTVLGVRVTVFTRRSESRAWAESDGGRSQDITELSELSCGYDIVFNTVPMPLLDQAVLSGMEPSTLIVDLASAPGGVTLDADGIGSGHSRRPRVIRAPSLPGRYAPVTAGEVIADCILDMLVGRGKEGKT